MKRLRLLLLVPLLFGCSHLMPDYMSIAPVVGKNTQVGAMPDHSKDSVLVYGISTEAGRVNNRWRYGLEFEATRHEYRSDNFTALDFALFGTYDIIQKETWQLYGGFGGGFGYSPDISYKYELVGDNGGWLGVLDYRIGLRKHTNFGSVSLEYKQKHWSAPFYHDPGENDDLILLRFSFPFGE